MATEKNDKKWCNQLPKEDKKSDQMGHDNKYKNHPTLLKSCDPKRANDL